MSRRRLMLLIAAFGVLAAVFAVGLSQSTPQESEAGPGAAPSPDEVRELLAGAPAPLAGLHRQASALLPGEEEALEARLRELRGHPVVVNKWASWCGPCRAEFPTFQRVSAERGKEVAFLGLNSGDARAPAKDFLRRFPLSFPSYADPREQAAQALGVAATYPMTVFYDARGKQTFIHQGPYLDAEGLEADIDRYALGAR
jgi:thiol-disulfide isomerase/thioredoxin